MTMSSNLLDRRSFLTRAALLGGVAAGASLLAACGKGGGAPVCTDTASLKPDELATRTSLNYVDASTDPTKLCSGCTLFVAGAEGACGSCQVVKGPINPNGGCISWAKKA
jgi:hypothetical protein